MKTLLRTMEIWLMMYLWCMTSLYLKTSVFICPLANKRLVFSKISTLESIFEKMCFCDHVRVDSRPNWTKSNVFFQTKRMRVDRAYYYFLCELPDVIKLCQTTRRCVRRWRPVRNETRYSRLAYCTDLHGRLSYNYYIKREISSWPKAFVLGNMCIYLMFW